MAIIQQINPQVISDRQNEIDRSRKLAALLAQNAQNTAVNREVSGRVVPVSPLEAIFKGLQMGTATYQDAKAGRMERQNELDKNAALVSALKGGGNIDQLAQSGAFDNDSLAKLIQDKQKAKEAQDLVDYKAGLPTTGQRDALYASGGDETKARSILENKIANPLGQLNYNLQSANVQHDNEVKDRQLKLQIDNTNTDNQFKQDQLALQKQNLDAQRAAAEAARNQHLADKKQSMLQNVPAAHKMAYSGNQASMNMIDRAIQTIKDNPDHLGMQNMVGDTLSQRLDPEGVKVRALVGEIGGVKRHDITGAAMSAAEAPNLKPFIPSATDNDQTAIEKLNNLKANMAEINGQIGGMYSNPEEYRNPIGQQSPQAPASSNVPEATKVLNGITFVKTNGKWHQVGQ